MKKMKYFAGLLAIAVLCAGCSPHTPKESQMTEALSETAVPPSETKTSSTEPPQETTEEEIPSYPPEPLEIEPAEDIAFQDRVEAENCDYSDNLSIDSMQGGFSGDGYLTGFSDPDSDKVKAAFSLTASQHYDITICVSADSPVTNALTLNGKVLGKFSVTQPQQFTRITFSGVYIPEGEAVLSVNEIDGFFNLDYFEITNSQKMRSVNFKADYPLSDEEASEGAREFMHWLSLHYGTEILSGQYVSGSENTELEMIHRLTGKYPAIRFADMGCYTENTSAEQIDVVGDSLAWAEQGGIVGLKWDWDAPEGISSVYAKDTDFRLSDAMPAPVEISAEPSTEPPDEDSQTEETEETELTPPDLTAVNVTDVALLKSTEIEKLVEDGTITSQCASLLRDIDSVSEALKPLAEEDIPVLWRPLHEAGGGWYWWGADGAEAYQWLWDVVYRRMTQYHNLHNLIWIWNGQDSRYLVNQYDIASLDIYLDSDETFSSRYEQFIRLYEMTGGEKILAISESSSIPEVSDCFRDRSIWSWCGLWYDEYLMTSSGSYNGTYTPAKKMISFYNSEAVFTLDDTKKGFSSGNSTPRF